MVVGIIDINISNNKNESNKFYKRKDLLLTEV